MRNTSISVVVPVYGCELSLLILHERLVKTLAAMTDDYELILVNDSSPGKAWEIISSLAFMDAHVVGVNLSRNFGQHYAITAGLSHAKGQHIVVMDCDLQDPPEEIPVLFKEASKGYDIVYGVRHERNDRFFKKLSSILFFWILNKLSNTKLDHRIANFSIIDRKVANAILSMGERFRTYTALIAWVGFKSTKVEVQHANRTHGKTTYTFAKSLSLALDLIVMQSDKLLRLSIKFGFMLSALSLIFGLHVLLKYIYLEIQVPGWTTLILSINFLFGAVFVNLGILGLYLGKTFEEVKRRPLFIVSDTVNFERNNPNV